MIYGSDASGVQLLESVLASVNADGGWAYYAHKASRLEPTCWALLALLDAGAAKVDEDRVRKALTLIATWQRENSLLSDVSGASPNFAFNSLAAIVINRALSTHHGQLGQDRPDLNGLLSAIQSGEGLRSGRSRVNRQNNELAGWPWHEGTSNWVEPTAWCTLALKKAGRGPREARSAARVAEAERMLIDRCCLVGGWNYGNSNMLGKEMRPYVSSSALALIALQDRRALPEVVRSAGWLAANWQQEPSALALALALIALRVHREATDGVERALRAHLAAEGPPSNLGTRALTSYALSGACHGYAALTL